MNMVCCFCPQRCSAVYITIIKDISAHQPQLMDDLFRLYNTSETQWIAAEMVKKADENE
jgi:hypothetical protein